MCCPSAPQGKALQRVVKIGGFSLLMFSYAHVCAFILLVNLLYWCPGCSWPALTWPPVGELCVVVSCILTAWEHSLQLSSRLSVPSHFSFTQFIHSTFSERHLCACLLQRWGTSAKRAEKDCCWGPCLWGCGAVPMTSALPSSPPRMPSLLDSHFLENLAVVGSLNP